MGAPEPSFESTAGWPWSGVLGCYDPLLNWLLPLESRTAYHSERLPSGYRRLSHSDCVGGLIDADDRPVFPKARVLVPSGELDYWRGDIPEGAPEVLTKQFQAAHRVIAAVGSRMQRLAGTEVVPGITRVLLPGHTPDHSGYRIVSGEDRILIWTDIVHLPGIQFPRPEATVAFDVDPAQAAATRRRIMAELAESRELVAGHHLDFPGIGYVAEDGDGFRFCRMFGGLRFKMNS